MGQIHLSNSKKRDAVVATASLTNRLQWRYVDDVGSEATTCKILRGTSSRDFGELLKQANGDTEELAKALIDGDPEVDLEQFGQTLAGTSRVYVNELGAIVHKIQQTEVLYGPDGEEKERRPFQPVQQNIAQDIPIRWTGRKIPRDEAIRRFVFSNVIQIKHTNGLTFDFLFEIARELAEEKVLLLVGGGEKGGEPLIFRRGALPYRGFLEGRVAGNKYALLLHLSNMELKGTNTN